MSDNLLRIIYLIFGKKISLLVLTADTKGQLISKCIFGVFTFFQKTNENKSTSSKVEFVRLFFGRNVCLKKSFRICQIFTILKKTAYKKLKKPPSETLFFSSLLPWAAQTAQTEEFMFQNMTYRPTLNKTGVGIYSGSREASRNYSLALLIHWWPPCIIFKATVNVVHIHIHLQTKIHTYMPKRYCTMCYKGPPD